MRLRRARQVEAASPAPSVRTRPRRLPQTGDGPYAGPFPAEFSELDLSQPAAVVHRHVASWRFVFVHEGERGPLTMLDGTRVRIVRTCLEDPGSGAAFLECADGPLWVLETESPEPAD